MGMSTYVATRQEAVNQKCVYLVIVIIPQKCPEVRFSYEETIGNSPVKYINFEEEIQVVFLVLLRIYEHS